MTSVQAGYAEIEEFRPRPPLFAMRGRIGRARYVVYGIGALCCVFLLMVLAGYALMLAGGFGLMLYQMFALSLYFIALPIFFLQLTIRRCHDFNMEGWLAVLMLVPVVNLMFWFIPGTRGENIYGRELEAETAGMRIAAVALPLLLIGAFLSADTRFPDDDNNSAAPRSSTPLRPYIP